MSSKKIKIVVAVTWICILAIVTIILGWDNWLNWLIFLSVTFGLLVNAFSAEGRWICYIFSIISYAIYIPFCIVANVHGELAVSFLVIFANFITLFKWRKNTKNKSVTINKLSFKENAICVCVAIVLTIALGFVFMAMETPFPFLNSICVVAIVIGFWFEYRISRSQFVSMVVNATAYLTLWLLHAIQGGDLGFLLFTIGGIATLGYSLYGLIRWGRLYKEQTFPN